MNFRIVSAFALTLLSIPCFTGCIAPDADSDEEVEEEELGWSEDALTPFQWSTPANVTTVTSADAVALGNYVGGVHMVHTGGTGTNLYHTVYDGTSWSATTQIPNQKSKNRPALATMGPKGSSLLHMVHQGETSDSLWWSTFDGSNWTENSQMGMSSTQAPVMAMYGVGLHLFGTNKHTTCSGSVSSGYSCTSNEVLWESTYDGITWSAPQEIVTSANRKIDGVGGAAVAVYKGVPILVVRRASNDLWMYTLQNGVWSGGSKIAGQKSQSAPALATYGGYLHMSHLGDSSNSVWWSYYDGVSWTANATIPSTTSQWATAMAPMSTKLVQAFRMYCDGACNRSVQFQTFQ